MEYLLQHTGYDIGKTKFLTLGFEHGFKIGHYDSLHNAEESFELSEGEIIILKQKIDKEIQLGRMAGPFSAPPFPSYHVSPLFLRPKTLPGHFRMIMDLSFSKHAPSINENILDSAKKVTYSNVKEAFDIAQRLPGGFSAKIDIQDAFRLLPRHASDLPRLCFKLGSDYYYDKVLPQGCGSSCALFERFATALQHIFNHFAPGCQSIHYLDDFLIFASTEQLCLTYRNIFVRLCKFLNVPLAPHKITVPKVDTTF